MPCAFGLAHLAFPDPQVSLFAAFGSFALLLLVDFDRKPRTRLISYVSLLLAGACLVALGTAASEHKAASIVAMAVVGFVVLYAGVASPSVATASTATLLMFVLPVAVAAPLSELGARLTGLGIAGALCIPACLLLWPPPWRDELRRRLSASMTAISRLVAAHAEGERDPASRTSLDAELASVRRHFAATPYPHAGTARGTVAARQAGWSHRVGGGERLARARPTTSARAPVRPPDPLEGRGNTARRRCAGVRWERPSGGRPRLDSNGADISRAPRPARRRGARGRGLGPVQAGRARERPCGRRRATSR